MTDAMSVSLASRVHAWLGKTFIASPEALRMPAWFYHLQSDRPQPAVSEFDSKYERNAIAIDFVRRAVMSRIGPIAVAMSVVCSSALLLLNAFITYLAR